MMMLIVDTLQVKCWEHVGNMLVKFSSPPSAAVTTRGSRPRHTACIVVSDEDEIGLERHTRGAKIGRISVVFSSLKTL